MTEDLTTFLKKIKGLVLTDFEKICPTEKSFEAARRSMHDRFDEIQAYIESNYTKK